MATQRELGPGVNHLSLVRSEPLQAVQLARIAPDAPFALRAIPANGAPGSGLERTSAICIRISCLAAVNGDFWQPRTGLPVGGLVSAGQLMRPPNPDHRQLVLPPEGGISTDDLELKGVLVPTDLRSVSIDAVDASPSPDGIWLFTPAYGTSAPPSDLGLGLRVSQPNGPLHLASTTIVRMSEMSRSGEPVPIPPDGAVLSGTGKGARRLAALWERVREGKAAGDALLRLESTPEAMDSLGGGPVLVRDGHVVAPNDATSFVRGRHPRTLVGRTSSGEAILATVDGRQPGYSEGMSLAEAAQLMIDLGAVDAINLDGGGSTTFVTEGVVVNRPSDRAVRTPEDIGITSAPEPGEAVLGHVERPVAVALALVPRSNDETPSTRDLLSAIDLPPVLDLEVPHAADPASDPSGSLPALVVSAPSSRTSPLVIVAVLLLALGLAVASVVVWERRIRGGVLEKLPGLERPPQAAKPSTVSLVRPGRG